MVVGWLLFLIATVAAEPPDACETMDPSHGGTPQKSPPPYQFYLHSDVIPNRLSAHFAIKSANPDVQFSGFMVQARDDTGKPIGEFDTGCVDIRVMTCFGVFANTAIHLDSEPKTEAHMRWLPDTDFVGNVTFFTTVAQSRQVYWVRHPARKLQVIQEDSPRRQTPTTNPTQP
ncbi:defense protein l(2)34Fc-like [Macrosteles quadrilineatus]|uniref:defense protein l(2)34Fc-like n=1 Tax=Macrosteles quadrilineatus TaxID=74068 RepID=UPI0023E2ECDB|nr:defense protein l(2)34Fc-like [Macrosteles quadrilineatus]